MIVAAARKYTGVKFRHLGRSPRALDCAGLVWRAYADCGVTLPDFLHYGREPHDDGLIRHVTHALGEPVAVAPVREDQLRVGDVIVVRFDIEPHHVALITDYPLGGLAMIHADGHNGKVIEHRLAHKQIARITHVFRRPI